MTYNYWRLVQFSDANYLYSSTAYIYIFFLWKGEIIYILILNQCEFEWNLNQTDRMTCMSQIYLHFVRCRNRPRYRDVLLSLMIASASCSDSLFLFSVNSNRPNSFVIVTVIHSHMKLFSLYLSNMLILV